MELLNEQIGSNAAVKAELADAKLKVSAELNIVILAKPVLEKIKELIPGHFEDAIIDSAIAKLEELAK